MKKKTILHIIQNLGRGGAETMLVSAVKELSDYNNIIVTLFPKNHFAGELKCDKYYCLNIRSVLLIPFAALRLKKFIKNNNIDIVHSHLFWPTVLARMATPKRIPLITTIHAFIATSVEYKIWYIKFLDKLTYKIRKSIIVAVASGALQEYFTFLNLQPYKSYTLYTFVDTKVFDSGSIASKIEDDSIFKIISVGALRKQKNQQYLIEVFKLLDNKKFQLDIYGEGPLLDELRESIDINHLNINLKGELKNIQNILPQYHLYVMSSTFEGFSLSVLEAMAMQIPLLFSDIKSFREQCESTAIYFSLDNVNDFVEKLQALFLKKDDLNQLASLAHERVRNNFTLEHHMQGLRKIYSEAINTG